MEVMLTLLVCLVFAYLASFIFGKIGIPKIIGHMTVGFILGIPLLKEFIFNDESLTLITSLANLGLIFMLYFIGLKINMKSFLRFSGKALNIALLSAVIPFALGLLISLYFGRSIVESVIIGACLSVTAEAVSGAILEELKLMNTRIGEIIIEAGILDDIFEILILAILSTLIHTTNHSIASGVISFILEIFLFVIIILIIRYFIVPFTIELLGKKPTHANLFTASFIIVLLMAAISDYLKMGVVLGAVIAGIIVKHTFVKEHKIGEEKEVVDLVETVTFGFLEPLFFIWIGINVDITRFFGDPGLMYFAIIITIVATLGKILGSLIGNHLSNGSVKEGFIIGWGMNSRGAVELIAATIALEANLITVEMNYVIVIMAFITTLISPLIFKKLTYHHHYKKIVEFN
jgi:Kef-type K+ transport system membrane component KefB